MLAKEIKRPITAGVILYGIELLIDVMSVLFQGSVYELFGGNHIAENLDNPIFPLITIYQIVILAMLAFFCLVIHKYNGTLERIVGIVMIIFYCIIAISYPYISVADTRAIAETQNAWALSAANTLNTSIGIFTLPFATIATALAFIAIGRYGVRRDKLVTDGNIPNNKIKIPMIVGIVLSAIALFIDLFIFASRETVYKIMNAPDSIKVTVFPITAVMQMIFTVLFVVFLLIMLKIKGQSTRIAAVVMTIIYCLLTISTPFIKMAYNTYLNSIDVENIAAGGTLESFISLCTPLFTVVSTVLIFIAIGRYGTMFLQHENNDNSDK